MTDKPLPEPEDTPEAQAEFQRVLGNLVNTPHKPHVAKSGDGPKAAPKTHQAKAGKSGGK